MPGFALDLIFMVTVGVIATITCAVVIAYLLGHAVGKQKKQKSKTKMKNENQKRKTKNKKAISFIKSENQKPKNENPKFEISFKNAS